MGVLTRLNKGAFANCYGLKSVVIPESVTSIGFGAFNCCHALTSVVFENTDGWFYDNGKKISSDDLSDPAKAAELLTFWNASSYGLINYSAMVDENATEGLKYTLNDDGESYSCSGYGSATDTAITISSTYKGLPVTAVKENAFEYNKNIVSVTIPDSVTSIESMAFYWCSNLTSVTMPDSVTSIGESAFGYCLHLTNVTMPESLMSIGNMAFYTCYGLTSITIPSGVTSIGYDAFLDCYKIVEVINYSDLNIKKGSSAYGGVAEYALNVKQRGTSDIVNKDDYLFYTYNNVITLIIY